MQIDFLYKNEKWESFPKQSLIPLFLLLTSLEEENINLGLTSGS